MEPNQLTSFLELTVQLSVNGELCGLLLKSKFGDHNLELNFGQNTVQFDCSCCRHNFVLLVEIEKEQKPKLEALDIFPEAEVLVQEDKWSGSESKNEIKANSKKKTKNGKNYKCTMPGCFRKVYSSRADLYNHVRFCHGEVTCEYCNKILNNKFVLMNHFNKVHKIGLEECPQCFRSFFANRLEKHIDIMHVQKRADYECHFCSYKVGTKVMIEKHLRRHRRTQRKASGKVAKLSNQPQRNTKEVALLCECHGRIFGTRSSLDGHLKYFKSCLKTLHVCRLCGEVFQTLFKLRYHSENFHRKEEWKCEKCTLVFATWGGLRRHRKFTHNNAPLHPCKICDKRFKFPYMVKEHMRIHSGEKVPCPYLNCDAAFANQGSMSVHKKQHRERGDQLK